MNLEDIGKVNELVVELKWLRRELAYFDQSRGASMVRISKADGTYSEFPLRHYPEIQRAVEHVYGLGLDDRITELETELSKMGVTIQMAELHEDAA